MLLRVALALSLSTATHAAEGQMLMTRSHLATLDRSAAAAQNLRVHTENFLVDQLGSDPNFLSTDMRTNGTELQIRAEVRNNLFDLVDDALSRDDLTELYALVGRLAPAPLPSGTPEDHNQNVYLGMLGTYADAQTGTIAYAQAIRNMALLSVLDTSRSRRANWKTTAYLLSTLTIMHALDTGLDNLIPALDATGTPNGGRSGIIARAYFPVFWAWDLTKSREARVAGDTFVRGGITTDFESFRARALVEFQREFLRGIHEWETQSYFNDSHFNNHLSAHLLGLAAVGVLGMDKALRFVDDDTVSFGSFTNPRTLQDMIDGAILMTGDNAPGIQVNAREHQHPLHFNTLVDGDIYDRYRDRGEGKGITYSMLSLDLLSITALILRNQGDDYLAYRDPGSGAFLGLGHARMADIFNSATDAAWLQANTVFDYNQGGETEYSRYIVGDPRLRSYFAIGRHAYCGAASPSGLTAEEEVNLCSDPGNSRVAEADWGSLTHHHPLLGPINFLLDLE